MILMVVVYQIFIYTTRFKCTFQTYKVHKMYTFLQCLFLWANYQYCGNRYTPKSLQIERVLIMMNLLYYRQCAIP